MIQIISSAQAASAAPAASGGSLLQLIPLVLFGIAIYFLMMRPQSKRAREQQVMLAGLAAGDEVVMAGGLLGRLIEVDPQFSTAEVAPGVQVRIQTSSVQMVLLKDTIKKGQ